MTYNEMIETTKEIESTYNDLKVSARSRSASNSSGHSIVWDYQNGKVTIAIEFVSTGGNITISKMDIDGKPSMMKFKPKFEKFFLNKYK